MSIDFNGTTSKLEHTLANVGGGGTVLSILGWALADGQGEGNLGIICAVPENAGAGGGSGGGLRHHNAANKLGFTYDFTGGGSADGAWSFDGTDGVWNAVGLSYDAGATTNVPVARVNFANKTVTTVTTPVGTGASLGNGYCIGNTTGQTRTWDGALAQVQVFNVILTAAEMDQALLWPGSVRRGLKLWQRMLHAGDIVDLSGNGFHGTATSLADRATQPWCGGPWPFRRGAQGALVPTVVAGHPAMRRHGGWRYGRPMVIGAKGLQVA